MAFSPFARFRNFTISNLKALLEVYPDLSKNVSWSEASEQIEPQLKGYKRTAYQQACQYGLEDRENDSFRIQSYLYTFDDENLKRYLDFWLKIYYAPNPYVHSDDEPILIFCELAKEILSRPELRIEYDDFFERRIGGGSDDILMNALKEYGAPLRYEKKDERHFFYVTPEDISDLKSQVAFIEEEYPIGDSHSKKEFFDRYSYSNFCKFYGIGDSPTPNTEKKDNSANPISGGVNVLFYGVPGSGKSYSVDGIIGNAHYERVVFHPDYTYSDFVGQIMPRLKRLDNGDEKLSYEFVPGPFTKALYAAEKNPAEMHYLVIEEINRGNAPAIFGDVFQLLDRDDNGCSKYAITNYDIAEKAYSDMEHEVRIPGNLTILATMNTSDQNVFTLDTAFQRRWDMRYVPNDIDKAEHADTKIQNSEVTWAGFANAINEALVNYNAELGNSEDKQLGAYFVRGEELSAEYFPQKVLKYLWDDAFRLDHDIVFKDGVKSIAEMLVEYQKPGDPIKRIMKAEVYNRMMDMSANNAAEARDESEVFDSKPVDEEE